MKIFSSTVLHLIFLFSFLSLVFVLSLTQKAFALNEPELVKDICPGSCVGYSVGQTVMGNNLYFRGGDSENGFELWKTDGTEAGTVLVKDINPGINGGLQSTNDFYLFDNYIYFTANDGVNGYELWKSDGSEAGTTMVKDINIGSNPSGIFHFTRFGSFIFFTANDGVNGYELWKSDGTEAGTILVKDINPGSYDSYPWVEKVIDNQLLFTASTATAGNELWKTDGTEAGTVLVKDIFPGSTSSYPFYFSIISDVAYFAAEDPIYGGELWKTDGTESGTTIVKDIYPGSYGGWPYYIEAIGDDLYFQAEDGINGYELWKSDGTDTGTVLVKDLYPGSESGSPSSFISMDDYVYFKGYDDTHGDELWKSDGTEDGTIIVKDINLGITGSSLNYLDAFTKVGGNIYFVANNGINGYELWKSDGTEEGTFMYKDIYPGEIDSNPDSFTLINSTLFFTAKDIVHGNELWKLTVDVIPPLGSLNINSGTAFTTSTSVSLTLSATDDMSTVTQMMICNNPSFTGCTWEPYATSKSWTLDSALGEKTVYVKFKDSENNISEVFSDTITYHVLAVDFVLIGTVTNIPDDPSLSLQLTSASQEFRGTTQPGSTVFFVVGGQTFSTVADSNGNFSITLTLSEGANEVQYYVKDLSNNQSETRTMSITVTPPAVVPVRWTLPNTGEENLEETPTVSPTISITITETPSTTLRPSLTPTIKPSTEEQDSDYVYIGPIKIKKSDIQVAKVLSDSVSNTGAVTMLIVAPLSLAILPQIFSKGFLWYLPPKKRKPWGVIYDLGTRKPIAFAIVRILDNTGKVLKETVSDLKGRYDFILDPGTYTMEIESGAFAKFTSQVTIRSTDEQHTEDVGLTKGTGINRFMLKEKLYYVYLYTFWIIGTIGLIFSGISLILGFDVLNLLILIFYAVQIYFLLKTRRPQNWGYVFDTMNNNRLTGVFVRIFGVTDGRQLNVILTDEKGRFSLRLDEGDYLLKTDMPGYILSESDYHIETLPTGDKVAKINAVDLKNGVELGMAKA